jgi:hypothetical protein
MSTAFLKTMFSSSSSRPTANNWNDGVIGNNTIGLDFPSSVAHGGTLYVAVGVGGYTSGFPIKYTTPTKIKYTTNFSSTWSSPATNLNDINFTRVRFLNGRVIALGRKASPENSIYVCFSTDGANWTTSTILPALISGLDYPTDIAWNGSKIAIISQESSALWVGELTEDLTWKNAGTIYYFPKREGEYLYCNLEGVSWINESTIVLVSDTSKKKQPSICKEKSEMIHIWKIK